MIAVIAGGGTAGHVNPAIALAGALGSDDVVLAGTERGVEARLVPAAGLRLETIDVRGFDRSKPWTIAATGLVALKAVRQAKRLLKQVRPKVVVGMGGYVSLPVVLAARSARIPVVLHEQNVVLGLAHKVSKPFARRIAVSFEETLASTGDKGVWTGNPVLEEITSLDARKARASAYERFSLDETRRTLLVFGGSLGARRVNQAAAGLAKKWADRADVQILHITGRNDEGAVRAEVDAAPDGKLIYRVVEFVDGMGEAYAVADLAVCRGGATTVAELCILGVPSVIVPYPHHRDRQQERHGRILEASGAAEILLDASTTTDALGEVVERLLASDDKLREMAAAAKRLGRPDAAKALAGVVRELAS